MNEFVDIIVIYVVFRAILAFMGAWCYFEWLRSIHLAPAEYRREINGAAK